MAWMKCGAVAFLLFLCQQASAQQLYVSAGGAPRSQVNPNFLAAIAGANEYKFLNALREGTSWTYVDNSGVPGPSELDTNGYPLFGANAFSHGGVYSTTYSPSQAERPGDYILTWIGGGQIFTRNFAGSTPAVSCTGVIGAGCDNSACSAFTGSIVGTTLHVSVASAGTGCWPLVAGQPISGAGITITQFGVPTVVTAQIATQGADVATFTVNFSQTVSSESIHPGGRYRVSVTAEDPTIPVTWGGQISTTSSGNTVQHLALYHIGDEPTYWTGQQSGTLFKARINQGNFAVTRDLNMTNSNQANCTTWATRKPAAYFSYASFELRASLTASLVTYNAGTDIYSISFGSGNWTDKETILVRWPATGTANSKVSLNGNAAIPILGPTGDAISSGTLTVPTNQVQAALVYDATIGGPLEYGGQTHHNGLDCGVPPEAFINMNAELGTNPWIVTMYLAVDPMTDFYVSYASYIKSNYPSMQPEFETPDEMWNEIQFPACYFSSVTRVYIAKDPAWVSGDTYCATGGNIQQELGKIASTLGQALSSVYTNGGYDLIIGAKTNATPSTYNPALLSTAYINQNPANIPTQVGYTKSPAYNYVTRVAVSNYWGLIETNTQPEVGHAYCYFMQSAGCDSASSIMTNYMNTHAIGTIIKDWYSGWNTFAATCAGHGMPCGVQGIIGYEGTFVNEPVANDATTFATSSNNSASCILTAPNGGVAGMSVKILAASGGTGTWATVVGNTYTVQATGLTTTALPINLDCSGLGTFASLTIDYVGSASYISYLRNSSYLSPDLATLTTYLYQTFISNGGKNPTLFTLGGAVSPGGWLTCGSGCYPWTAWSTDIYGYFTIATCTLCTISGTTLTLGGTVTGMFQPTQTIFGKGVAIPTTIVGSCATSGPLPCGANSGDTLTLSQSSTVGVGEPMTGNVTPKLDPAGTATDSPITQWRAIRQWNGNSGGFLFKRDLSPVNDNSVTPAFINEAA